MVQLTAMQRTALDWAHWDEPSRFMGGQFPGFMIQTLDTAALVQGEALLGLLNPDASPRLSYGQGGQRAPHPAAPRLRPKQSLPVAGRGTCGAAGLPHRRRLRGPRGADQSRATLLGACQSLALRISAGFGEAVTAEVEGHRLEIGLSIGAALVDPNEVSVESAMRRSDVAMYRAKQARHGRVAIIDTSDGETDLDTYALYGDLMQAVRDDALAVEFQPVVDGKGVMHSVEALARWHHPERGPIDPETFLALAERHRQAMAVGEALIRQSLASFALLVQAAPDLSLALHLASSTLSDPALGERLGPWLAEAGIAPEQVTIELTERSVLEPTATVRANLVMVRSLRMKLALDEFGTGYSSLNPLTSLKPDTVKIDQSFVRAMESDPYAHQIVSLIAGLNSRMNLNITAEGVETRHSVELLQALGIQRFQGCFFSLPKSAAALLEKLAMRPSTMGTPS